MRLLALLAAGLFTGTLIAADDKKKDEEAILGTWKVEKIETGGDRDPSKEELAELRITFKKDGKMVMTGIPSQSRPKQEGEYKLDPSAKVKTLDFTLDSGTKQLGVYELSGDSLKICQGNDKKRPTEFKGDGKGAALITLKREKDEKKDEPKKDK